MSIDWSQIFWKNPLTMVAHQNRPALTPAMPDVSRAPCHGRHDGIKCRRQYRRRGCSWGTGQGSGGHCHSAWSCGDRRARRLQVAERVALVLSRQHPTGDWLRHGGDYFDVRIITETWSKGWNVRYWLAPLQVTCEEIAAAGFWVERLVEPRLLPETAAIDPREYERLCREPTGFLAFRLRPRT